MKPYINILKAWSWRNIIKILIIAGAVFLPETGYHGIVAGEEIKCRNFCCIMFIKAIGVVIKHEWGEEDRILHSRTCELLENTDPHGYLFCNDIELAFSKGFVMCESCNLC
jgi:hypothetical protein